MKLAFELTVLCATRTEETLGATWAEVDLDTKTWTIPGIRMKKGLEHRVPLSRRCVEVLKRAKGLSDGGPYVFPGRSANKPLSNMVFLMTVRRMTQQKVFVSAAPYTPHGFRSSFRNWAEERTSVPHAVKEAALAHALPDKTEKAYNRTDLFERRRALMDSWSRFATTTPAKVLPIRA